MEESVKDRLLDFLSYQRISINKFEKTAGLSIGYMKSLRHAPSADKLKQILDAFPDLSRAWLLTGEGPMLVGESCTDPNTIPLIPDMAVGGLPDGVDISGYKETDCPRCVSPEPSADFAIDVTGDSMAPDYPSGCRVYLTTDTSGRPIRYGEVYVLDTAEGILLKRVFEASTPDHLRLVSINAEYPPYNFPKSEIRGLYRVISRLIKQ